MKTIKYYFCEYFGELGIGAILLALLWILLFFCCSCRPVKEFSKTETGASAKNTHDYAADSLRVWKLAEAYFGAIYAQSERELMQSYEGRMNTTIVDYDTDKPIVPETGKPPVKRETLVNSEETNRSEERDRTQYESLFKSEKAVSDSLRAEIRKRDEAQSTQEERIDAGTQTGLTGWQSFQIWCGRIWLALIILWVVLRIRRMVF